MRRPFHIAPLAPAACASLFVVTALAVRLSSTVRAHDAIAFDGFLGLGSLDPLLSVGASLGNPVPYLLLGGLCAAVAAARGLHRRALAILVLLAATGAATQALKVVLDQGTLHPGAFPSGHATAALTLAFAAVLAAPRDLRPPAVLGGAALACTVAFSILALGWHSPSDVLGGFLVAATLTAAAVAFLDRAEVRGTAVPVPVPARTGLLVAVGVAAGVPPALVASTADLPALTANGSAVAAAAAIGVLALTLVAALARIAR